VVVGEPASPAERAEADDLAIVGLTARCETEEGSTQKAQEAVVQEANVALDRLIGVDGEDRVVLQTEGEEEVAQKVERPAIDEVTAEARSAGIEDTLVDEGVGGEGGAVAVIEGTAGVDLDRAGAEAASLKVVDGRRSRIHREGERLGHGVLPAALNEMAAARDAELLKLSGGEGAVGKVDGAGAAGESSNEDRAAGGGRTADAVEDSLAEGPDGDYGPSGGYT